MVAPFFGCGCTDSDFAASRLQVGMQMCNIAGVAAVETVWEVCLKSNKQMFVGKQRGISMESRMVMPSLAAPALTLYSSVPILACSEPTAGWGKVVGRCWSCSSRAVKNMWTCS